MPTRYRFLPTLLAAVVLATSTACATNSYGRYPGPGSRVGVSDRAYRFGYDAGFDKGREDIRRGRSFDLNRHGDYRNANRGYDGYGNRNQYRNAFRQAFAAGYEDGYGRIGGVNRGRRQGPVFNDNRNGGVFRSPAADSGFRDGYSAGRDDARDGDRYDPRRNSRYRDGDRDYDNRYGSRDAYKAQYRDAFMQGYERGYREVRR